MTRTGTRELAVRLVFALGENGRDAGEAGEFVDEILSEEYYTSLRGEDELYNSAPRGAEAEYLKRVVTGVAERAGELDGFIEKHAVGWQLHRISSTAAAIMRVAIFETLYMPDIPISSSIDAAVDLAKKYETPETAAFINGVLGAFARSEGAFSKSELLYGP